MGAKTAQLTVGSKSYGYYPIAHLGDNIAKLPFSMKVLLENLARHLGNGVVEESSLKAVANWWKNPKEGDEIAFYPARVLMQDFTGVPAVVDLAAMREVMKKWGESPEQINPLVPVDLVIDHSLSIEHYATKEAFEQNVSIEYERNNERYTFLRWGQKTFNNFRVVPPGTGICHQVNLEYLAQTVWCKSEKGQNIVYPDTLVGTDSHTTMINGLSVLGWGVGGIEAEAAMLGQPVSMLIPEVVGVKITGKLREGATATDAVLTVTQMLRKKGVVGKFVEFFGDGLDDLELADRATLANMAPEYGATCGIFPIDQETLNYLRFSGRDEEVIALVEAYAKAQGMWRVSGGVDPVFSDTLHLDLSSVVPSMAGPKRPQDRVELTQVAAAFPAEMMKGFNVSESDLHKKVKVENHPFELTNGDVVIASITSCTNTSNPSVMLAAGLVAKKAHEKGLKVKPWVKTSLAPGSQVVTDYLLESGLQQHLDAMGFHLVGYGCTTCIGNSGPLKPEISKAINDNKLVAAAVLSGNRNFEGRVSPDVRANYLAGPPLVVAYAIAGSMYVDLTKDSLGKDKQGKDVYLKDIWPSNQEIKDTLRKSLGPKMFKARYGKVFDGDHMWQAVKAEKTPTYHWPESTYIKHPTFFEGLTKNLPQHHDLKGARVLCLLGDSVTTDHISPAGNIKKDIPAGKYLTEKGIKPFDFNSFGARRGNHEIMMRGTFGNMRIKNELTKGVEGPVTLHVPSNQQMYIFDAAVEYQKSNTPLIVIGGKEYGTGSSRDWAAKGTFLLGVKAVLVESFERIHRSNLVGMGVLPLQFAQGMNRQTLKLTGKESFDIEGIKGRTKPGGVVKITIHYENGETKTIEANCRLDTQNEVEYFNHGGILQYVLRQRLEKK